MQRLRRQVLLRDVAALLLLLGLVLAFLMPGLLLREGLLFDDAAYQSFPRLLGVARAVQAGEIPLADPNCFCGARPFFAMLESPIYNPLLYPFLLLADTDNIDQAYYVLYVIPFVLFVLLAAAGQFVFARMAVRVNRAGAVVMGLTYALAPHLGTSIISMLDTCAFAWLPWIVLAVGRYIGTGKTRWWCAGAVCLALMACANDTNYTIRIYFLSMLAAVLASLWLGRSWRESLSRLAATAVMFAMSVGLAAVMWAGVLEGVGWTANTAGMSYEQLTGSELYNMHPANLLTMFVPDFWGTLVSGPRAWGTGLQSNHSVLLAGGLCAMLCCGVCMWYWPLRPVCREQDRVRRCWARIAAIVLIGSLLVMMGRYTPLFKVLCAALPWFFRVPYAFYYHFAQCWSVALLVGLAVASCLTLAPFRRVMCHPLVVTGYLLLVAGGAIAAMFVPITQWIDGREISVAAHRTLSSDGWRQLILEPVTCFVLVSAVLCVGVCMVQRRRFCQIVIAGVVLETVVFAYPVFYRNLTTSTTMRTPLEQMSFGRFALPSEHPFYRPVGELARAADSDSLWISTMSAGDNLAWVVNGRAAAGYDAKPLLPRFQRAITSFMNDWPYQLWSTRLAVHFLRNMNVGYLLAYEGMIDPQGIRTGTFDGVDVYWLRDPRQIEGVRSCEALVTAKDARLYELPAPLPAVYVQDRVVALDAESQFQRLMNSDLRRAAYLEPHLAGPLPTVTEGELPAPEEAVQQFEQLQAANPVVVTQRRANSMTIRADITTPVMLVIAETYQPHWRAMVDGKPAQVLPINYLQQGVWILPGKHEIILKFLPENTVRGLMVSGCSLLILLGIAVVGWRRGFARRESGG